MSEDNQNTAILRPGQNGAAEALTRVGFGTVEQLAAGRETQGTALAARAAAEVQARYVMAMQRPRNMDEFRVRLLDHCRRPSFARIAEYEKPVGGQKIRGPSIRFVETALREFGNNLPVAKIAYEDDLKRVVEVSVTDLERNVTYYDDASAEKFVERKHPKSSDEVLSSRINSYGETVYKIRATEDDFVNKIGSAVSKKTRNLGLKLLPADIVEEAMYVCKKTREDADAKDPAAARRQLVDAFAAIRVMPTDLDAYLGHAFDQASPAELDELRAAYVTVRDGEAKFVDLVEAQRVTRGEIEKPTKGAEVAREKLNAKIEDVKAKQKAKAEADAKAKAAAAPKSDTKPADAKADGETELTEDEKRQIEKNERGGK